LEVVSGLLGGLGFVLLVERGFVFVGWGTVVVCVVAARRRLEATQGVGQA
jgi:hypothetical protein